MAITPYNAPGSMLGFAAYQPKFIGRPVNDIAKMVDYRTQQNQRLFNQASATDLALSNVDINPEDTSGQHYLLQHKQRFKNTINDIIDNNNYKLAPALISKVTTDFVKDKGLQTAVANQKAREQYRADLQKRYEDGKISEAGYIKGMSQGAVDTKIDPNTGIYNKFVRANIYNYYDADKDFSDYADKFEPTETKYLPQYTYALDKDGKPTSIITGWKQLTVKQKDLNTLKTGLITLATTNPNMYNSMKQEAEHLRMNVNDYIELKADDYVNRESGKKYDENGALYNPYSTFNKNDSNGNNPNNPNNAGYGETQGFNNNSHIGELSDFLITGKTKFTKALDNIENSNMDWGLTKSLRNLKDKGKEAWYEIGKAITDISNGDTSKAINDLRYKDPNYDVHKNDLLPSDEKDIKLLNNVLKYHFGIDDNVKNMSKTEQQKWLPKIGTYLKTNFSNEVLSPLYAKPDLSTTDGLRLYKGELLGLVGKEDGEINIGDDEMLSGNASNMLWYDKDNNKLYTAQEFTDAVNNNKLGIENGNKKVTFKVKGKMDYKNPLYEMTGSAPFTSNVTVADINGHEFYGANPNNNIGDFVKHKFYNLKHSPIVAEDLSNQLLPRRILTKYGNKVAVKLKYNKTNNKYSLIFDNFDKTMIIGKYDEESLMTILTNKDSVAALSYMLTNKL